MKRVIAVSRWKSGVEMVAGGRFPDCGQRPNGDKLGLLTIILHSLAYKYD